MDKAKLEQRELKDQAVVQKGQLKNTLFLMKNNKIHKPSTEVKSLNFPARYQKSNKYVLTNLHEFRKKNFFSYGCVSFPLKLQNSSLQLSYFLYIQFRYEVIFRYFPCSTALFTSCSFPKKKFNQNNSSFSRFQVLQMEENPSLSNACYAKQNCYINQNSLFSQLLRFCSITISHCNCTQILGS